MQFSQGLEKTTARAAQKKQVIELSQVETTTATQFVGYEELEAPAKVLEVIDVKDKTAVILDTSPFYAEMGGQVGDTGELSAGGQLWRITNTQKAGDAWLHFLASDEDSRRNRVIAEMAEPGSTFKIVTVSGALSDHLVKLTDVFDCENGGFFYAGRVLKELS